MTALTAAEKYPELVFGIAGPIGIDLEQIVQSLAARLQEVGYSSHNVRLTAEMLAYPVDEVEQHGPDFYSQINYKMDYANAICRAFGDPAALARIAILTIMRTRAKLPGSDEEAIRPKNAYIVRQFKRPDEIKLLRAVYGRRFVLISGYGSREQRTELLKKLIKRSISTKTTDTKITCMAEELINRDAGEDDPFVGQQLVDTYHLADVFVDGVRRPEMDRTLERFIAALFGRTDISPSKTEYGMYAAKSAALRSTDLSRQVGAAIFTDDGELITQGCNEVPKAFGGTYWDSETPDHRDVRLGLDPNELYKREILRDLVERLAGNGLLSQKAEAIGSSSEIVANLMKRAKKQGEENGALVGASILDLTEFGRVVHAEMCAICDAARLGRSIKGATLFCTTFPCHNCTKHVLGSGIRRVVYIEPYPKSKAKELHENEISIEEDNSDMVSFMPFLGISPFRYREIFQKGKRKNGDGSANAWYRGDPQPMLDDTTAAYIDEERNAVAMLLGDRPPA